MLLFPLGNMFSVPAAFIIIVLINLFSSFGELNGTKLPLENSNIAVELPTNVEDNMELNTPKGNADPVIILNDYSEDDLRIKSEMPKWLYSISGKNQSDGHQVHVTVAAPVATSPPRRPCVIQIIDLSIHRSGVCQYLYRLGNACVGGEFIDLFNEACL